MYLYSVFLRSILGHFWVKSVKTTGVKFKLREIIGFFSRFSQKSLVFPCRSQEQVSQNTFLSFSLRFCSLFKNHYKNAAKKLKPMFSGTFLGLLWGNYSEFCTTGFLGLQKNTVNPCENEQTEIAIKAQSKCDFSLKKSFLQPKNTINWLDKCLLS